MDTHVDGLVRRGRSEVLSRWRFQVSDYCGHRHEDYFGADYDFPALYSTAYVGNVLIPRAITRTAVLLNTACTAGTFRIQLHSTRT